MFYWRDLRTHRLERSGCDAPLYDTCQLTRCHGARVRSPCELDWRQWLHVAAPSVSPCVSGIWCGLEELLCSGSNTYLQRFKVCQANDVRTCMRQLSVLCQGAFCAPPEDSAVPNLVRFCTNCLSVFVPHETKTVSSQYLQK